jgi:hypothetical protein
VRPALVHVPDDLHTSIPADPDIVTALLIMKRCDHTHWLRLSTHGNAIALLESDMLQALAHHIPNPDVRKPSLLMLIDKTAKLVAL